MARRKRKRVTVVRVGGRRTRRACDAGQAGNQDRGAEEGRSPRRPSRSAGERRRSGAGCHGRTTPRRRSRPRRSRRRRTAVPTVPQERRAECESATGGSRTTASQAAMAPSRAIRMQPDSDRSDLGDQPQHEVRLREQQRDEHRPGDRRELRAQGVQERQREQRGERAEDGHDRELERTAVPHELEHAHPEQDEERELQRRGDRIQAGTGPPCSFSMRRCRAPGARRPGSAMTSSPVPASEE